MHSPVIAFEVEPFFVSKWYLNRAAVEGIWYLAAALSGITTMMAMVNIRRVVAVLNFAAPESEPIPEVSSSWLMATWILAPANFYPGINASANVFAADKAARQIV